MKLYDVWMGYKICIWGWCFYFENFNVVKFFNGNEKVCCFGGEGIRFCMFFIMGGKMLRN